MNERAPSSATFFAIDSNESLDDEVDEMKIGLVTDSLARFSLDELLKFSSARGVEGLEFTTGNWSTAPHLDLDLLLTDQNARLAFPKAVRVHNLEIIALNANGNQLHPSDGERQSRTLHRTIELADHLGVKKVCLMSGLPGGAAADQTPNWIVSSWPPETQDILDWQWNERLLPYWFKLAKFAREHGVEALCIELHGNQLVYNVPTLMRLREAIGPIVGANLDPSHLMWMGADPLAAVDHLGPAIYHVHAKDTFINQRIKALTSQLDNGSAEGIGTRAWSYVTLGYGKEESWWKQFCLRLRVVGYDGWLSIEHEDEIISREEGVTKAIELLRSVAPKCPSDYTVQRV
jgi:sugar phosphate isomerase/epimerase